MRRALACGPVVWALMWAAPTWAQQRQLGPDPTEVWEGHMNYAATAGTLLECNGGSCVAEVGLGGEACRGLSTSTIQLDTIPELPGMRVVHARLSWIASTGENDQPDQAVTLVPPGGAAVPVAYDPAISQAFVDGISPDECQTLALFCGDLACDLGFYAANADVTDALNAHLAGGGTLNGAWTLRDVHHPGHRSQRSRNGVGRGRQHHAGRLVTADCV